MSLGDDQHPQEGDSHQQDTWELIQLLWCFDKDISNFHHCNSLPMYVHHGKQKYSKTSKYCHDT